MSAQPPGLASPSGLGSAGDPVAVKPPSRRAAHPIVAFLARRLAVGALILLVMSALIFAATNVLPGNVAQTVLGKEATPERVAKLEHRLDLDRPLIARYGSWLGGAVHGDFGRSAVAVAENNLGSSSVAKLMAAPLLNSAVLAVLAMLVILPVSVLLGALAGMRGGSGRDYAISYTALVLGAFPEFVLGIILIAIFFSTLGWLLPVALVPPGDTPFDHPKALVLPLLTLVGVSVGWAARQVRAGMVEVMRQDYVTMARLAGIPERRVLWRYALRNALATSVQVLAQTGQYLLGGIIVVEVLFSYRGLGNLLVQSVGSRDTTVVQAVALVVAALYILINIVADLIVVFIVPKLRTAMLE